MSQAQSILLESGTNELEIVTYTVGENLFSINVMKVREIINPFLLQLCQNLIMQLKVLFKYVVKFYLLLTAMALNLKSTKPLDRNEIYHLRIKPNESYFPRG